MKEAEVLIEFDLSKLDQNQCDKFFKIEKLFNDIGITFVTGTAFGMRYWELNQSLRGPVKVYLKKNKENKKE
jgi:hypothetical protein